MPKILRPPVFFNFATDVVDRWARLRPQARALWCVEAGSGQETRLTFREVSALSRKAANFYRECGIRRGERVLVMLPRVPEWWVAMLGLIRLGAVPVPATLLLTPREVAYRMQTARISGVVTSEEGVVKLEGFSGIRIFAGRRKAEAPSGWFDWQRGIRAAGIRCPRERFRSGEPGVLYFTSATSGDPKMVLHSQASYGLGHCITGRYWLDLRPEDVHWNISDLGWGKAAWSSLYGPWQMGACVFALNCTGRFDPGLTLDTLARFPITTWCAPPTALRLIIRQDLSQWSFPSLRHCVTAGEPLNPEVLELWRASTGLTLHEGYGQTETVLLVGNCPSLGRPVRSGSMGVAVPGFELALLDGNLREVPPGEEGQIAIRLHPTRPLGLFLEYWLNPDENARKFQGDWYLTGDQAVRDAAGYFWFIGRKDDVIKSSGYRIGPFEVESALLEHPAVLEVAVVGKADPLRGQIVKACVVLRPGIVASEELKLAMQTHCKRLVAAYKYPREVEFMAELPKTTSGKTRHVQLRQAEAAPAVRG